MSYCVYQVRIADGIQFVREITCSSDENSMKSMEGNGANSKVDVIVIDVDSSDPR